MTSLPAFPDGYDTIVGERGMQLFGRSAAAYRHCPAPLLKNAPGAGFWTKPHPTWTRGERESQLRQALEHLMQGRAPPWSSPIGYPPFVTPDRIVVLDRGQAIESRAATRSCWTAHGLYAQLVATPVGGARPTARNLTSGIGTSTGGRPHHHSVPLPAEWTGAHGGHHHH